MLSLLLPDLLLLHLLCIPWYLDGCFFFVFLFDVIPMHRSSNSPWQQKTVHHVKQTTAALISVFSNPRDESILSLHSDLRCHCHQPLYYGCHFHAALWVHITGHLVLMFPCGVELFEFSGRFCDSLRLWDGWDMVVPAVNAFSFLMPATAHSNMSFPISW